MAQLSAQNEGPMSAVPHQRWPEAEPAAAQLHVQGEAEISTYVRSLVNAVTSIRLASEARRRWVARNGSACPEAEKMGFLIQAEMDRIDDMAHGIIGLVASVRAASAPPPLPVAVEAAPVSPFRPSPFHSTPGPQAVRRASQTWARHG
ncbi:hypothetical protein [Azospirillum endophyticum]